MQGTLEELRDGLPEAVRAALPTFFIVGAPKAGTTSLHAYLAEHPDIAMTAIKEPMCFATKRWHERLGEYREYFDRLAPVRGESSTAYAAYPWAPDVPARIAALVPEARIVYLVRDPVARTVSHYAQNVWDEFPVRSFDELMDDLEDGMNMPVWCSRFATQLERYLDVFDADRVLVLDQRDLQVDRTATVQRVCAFLGVDASFASPRWDEELNTAGDHRRPNGLAHRLGRPGLAAARRGVLPRLLTREVPKPELREDQRRRLEALLRPEADRLRELTGLRLEHWSV